MTMNINLKDHDLKDHDHEHYLGPAITKMRKASTLLWVNFEKSATESNIKLRWNHILKYGTIITFQN